MEGTTEKDCSPLWSLYQQILSDMKNSTPMWEEFISKATKLHSALKSALSAIAAFLDSFQKIADAATNARGATKEIGTALTRVCLRHRAIETKMKTFIGVLMDALINPLSERSEEWRRGCGTGALSREHARECKRARTELRRRVHDAQRNARKARRAPPDAKRRADVSLQDVQERRSQLEEMEERAVKAALVEERSRFCHFVSLLTPVVESEVAMLSEVGHLQEGSEQLTRHTAEPRTLPAASLQVVCDIKALSGAWSEASSPPGSRLGSRKSSLTSLCSINTSAVSVSCSTPLSGASSEGTLPLPGPFNTSGCSTEIGNTSTLPRRLAGALSADSGFRSAEALHRQLARHVENGSDNQSVRSECATPAPAIDCDATDSLSNAASATWPDLQDAAQFERAASALMGSRPHTISAAFERGHPRPALSALTFTGDSVPREPRPPLPTRCSSLERPPPPARPGGPQDRSIGGPLDRSTGPYERATGPVDHRAKPSSLPPHLTKELPAVYVNMSELASLAARHDHGPQEKVCSESSASESSLESSSGYGSQGAFAAEDSHLALQHEPLHEAFCYTETIECQIVTLRRPPAPPPPPAARSLAALPAPPEQEEGDKVEGRDGFSPFATVVKPATRPRPLSLTAAAYARRGSCGAPRPPPPVRRSSSISRRPDTQQSPTRQSDAESLPPPPAFLLQPEHDSIAVHQASVAETIKQLTELRHTPASPAATRRADTGHRVIYEQTTLFQRSNLHSSLAELRGEGRGEMGGGGGGGREGLSSFGPRGGEGSHYGHTGFKLQQEKQYGGIYAAPQTHTPAQNTDRRPPGLVAALSARLAPQLSPRSARRHPPPDNKNKPGVSAALQPGFLDKLSLTLQPLNSRPRAAAVRDILNSRAQPDPRACHSSLMEQIKRGATLRRNRQCRDRSAPMIR